MILRWRDLRRGWLHVSEGEDENGSPYWASTLLLTDWGGGDSERGTGFLALSCDASYGVSIYRYATSCQGHSPAMAQDWLVPRGHARMDEAFPKNS